MSKPTLNEIIFFLAGLLMILIVLPVALIIIFILSIHIEDIFFY